MDETVETLLVGVRADTATFAADAASMRTALEGSLGAGADGAGALIERSLAKAVRSGQLGFDDLKRTALAALSEIAAGALGSGLSAVAGGTAPAAAGTAGTGGGGLLALGGQLLASALGLPGRATGGPVSPGRTVVVGERGPELFVPTSAGTVLPAAAPPAAARTVSVSIDVQAPAGSAPEALARSGRQVARAVAAAMAEAQR